jgi:hypothetical protein
MSAKIHDKTIGQHLTAANKTVAWLKKLKRALAKFTGPLAKLFAIDPSNLNPPANDTPVILLNYIGEATTLDDYLIHLRKLENTFDVRFDDFGSALLPMGKGSVVTVQVKSAFDNSDEDRLQEPDFAEGQPVEVTPEKSRRKRQTATV